MSTKEYSCKNKYKKEGNRERKGKNKIKEILRRHRTGVPRVRLPEWGLKLQMKATNEDPTCDTLILLIRSGQDPKKVLWPSPCHQAEPSLNATTQRTVLLLLKGPPEREPTASSSVQHSHLHFPSHSLCKGHDHFLCFGLN